MLWCSRSNSTKQGSSWISPTRASSLTTVASFSINHMKDYAREFYSSTAWQACRAAYSKQVRGLCEICLSRGIYKPGEIVHHKVHITPQNINDPAVTLSFDNLQLVCRDCHAEQHRARKIRYAVDDLGRVTTR